MKYVSIQGDTATIRVSGSFDFMVAGEVSPEISTALSSGCTKFVVDLSETTFIDSSTIRELNRVRHRIGKDNFRAFGATGEVYITLYTGKFDELWNIPRPEGMSQL